MSRAPSGIIFDPDLDTQHRPPAVEAESVVESQRLVANPALIFLVWLLAFLVVRYALIGHHLGLFFAGLFLAAIPLPGGQFHCLDCGKTGWAIRASRHLCPTVIARCHGQVVTRIPFPRLASQFIIWICLAVLALLCYAILGNP